MVYNSQGMLLEDGTIKSNKSSVKKIIKALILDIFEREWSRANRLIPDLSTYSRPRVKLSRNLPDGIGAKYYGKDIVLNENLLENERDNIELCIRELLRHEIAHVIASKHNKEFRLYCGILGGSLKYIRTSGSLKTQYPRHDTKMSARNTKNQYKICYNVSK